MDRVISREKPGALPNYALNNLIMRYIQSLGLDMTDSRFASAFMKASPIMSDVKTQARPVLPVGN